MEEMEKRIKELEKENHDLRNQLQVKIGEMEIMKRHIDNLHLKLDIIYKMGEAICQVLKIQ